MANSKDYWAKREEEALRHYVTDEKEYDRRIAEIYRNMQDSIQEQIDGFYGRYASAEGITIAEAKKRVSQADIEAFERKAARYVKDKDFSKRANEEMRLYNATMRINRLEMLKANIGLEAIAGHDELEKYMEEILQGRTMEELERQAGILGKTVRNNAAMAHSIVNASFHNATFSDRVWQYQDMMKADLSNLLQSGLIQGKNPRALAKDLRKYFIGNDGSGGARYCMERLMRTELARVQTDAQKRSFERNGFGKYMFIVNSGCCDVCQAVAKKNEGIYDVEKMMPGENAPPMHPHCRCSTAAYEDNDEYEAWLDYLDKGGTTEEWNATGKAAWQNAGKPLTNASKGDTMQPKEDNLHPRTLAGVERGEEMTFEEANSGKTNPRYGQEHGYSINCQSCVVANEARRRGYNVETLPNTNNPTAKQLSRYTNMAWIDPATGKNPEYITDRSKVYTAKSYGKYLESIIEAGKRYTLEFGWKGRGNSGHIVNLERTDSGELRIKDNQRGKGERSEWVGEDVYRYLTQLRYSRTFYGQKFSTTPKVLRIDNMEFDPKVAEGIMKGFDAP